MCGHKMVVNLHMWTSLNRPCRCLACCDVPRSAVVDGLDGRRAELLLGGGPVGRQRPQPDPAEPGDAQGPAAGHVDRRRPRHWYVGGTSRHQLRSVWSPTGLISTVFGVSGALKGIAILECSEHLSMNFEITFYVFYFKPFFVFLSCFFVAPDFPVDSSPQLVPKEVLRGLSIIGR